MLFAAGLAFSLAHESAIQGAPIGINPPKLVVVISVDQLRADYIQRFAPFFLPAKSGGKLGGVRYLLDQGAYFYDAHHAHVPTATGPGHAALLTGSIPAIHGIAGNDWYDRAQGKMVYCVSDPTAKTIGGTSGPMSPRTLKVTTVGDELKMATNGKSKVVGLAFKDRASILMAGSAADSVVWFDSGKGNWVTSDFYAKNGELPAWAAAINASREVDEPFKTAWEPLLADSAYAVARTAPGRSAGRNGRPFRHVIGSGDAPNSSYFTSFITSRFGNEFMFSSAEKAIIAEGLGKDEFPDIFAMNLSTNDYVGHSFGPNSPEVMDITIRTDRLFSQFFNFLDRQVGMKNVTLVVTSDHGVGCLPEESGGLYRTQARRFRPQEIIEKLEAAIDSKFGTGDWIIPGTFDPPNIYLNRATAQAKGIAQDTVDQFVAETLSNFDAFAIAFTRKQMLTGALPQYSWVEFASNGYHPKLSGDVFAFEVPGALLSSGTSASHGTVWAYDSHIPIVLAGKGIRAGHFGRRAATYDIASTLSYLLGTEYPSGNIGKPLYEAIAPRKSN